MSECLLSIGGHTVGPTELKFGKEDDIYPGRLQDAFCSGTPSPWVRGGQRVVLEVHAAQTLHFCVRKKIEAHP